MIIVWNFCLLLLCTCLHLTWALTTGTRSNGVRYNLTKNLMDGQWANTHVYAVSGSGIRLYIQGHPPGSGVHQLYYVKNIGRGTIHAYARIGNAWQWLKAVSSADILPGQMVSLDPSQDALYTQLVVDNYGDQRGYAQCLVGNHYDKGKSSPSYWNFEIDMNNLMKKLVTFASGYLPYIGPVVSEVIDFFWPSTSIDVWEEVKNKVSMLIDNSISDLVENILDNRIRVFQKRIEAIAVEQAEGVNKAHIKFHYLNIAQDMVGLEEEFRFQKHINGNLGKINYATLPLFSMVVSLKIMFYRCGLENPDALGLDADSLKELKIYASLTLNPETGIILKHFQDTMQQQTQHTYNEVDPDNLFNDMANILTFIAYNGEQYWAVWNDQINGSPANGKPYNPVLLYSSYIGTPTADLLSLGGQLPLMRTLTPQMKDGKRPRIVMVQVHTAKSNACGIDVHYDDKSVISTGRRYGTRIDKFTIEPHYIVKLNVWGDFPGGIIRGLDFITDGNVTYQSGTTTYTIFTFEMENHHIAGIHMSNDMGLEISDTWNVAVSYQADSINHD